MRLFIYEYTSATSSSAASVRSLESEGWAMLCALLADFGRVPGVQTVTLFGSDRLCAGTTEVKRTDHTGEEVAFRDLARGADFTLVVAPEFDNLLLVRSRWVEEAGGRLLGCSPSAVALTGDKLALCGHLQHHGVATPTCRQVESLEQPPEAVYPCVWKPRRGAGSIATFLVQGRGDWTRCLAEASTEGWRGETLVQAFAPGLPASVALLIGGPEAIALLPAAQILSQDGRFHYLGGSIPLPPALGERAVRLATRAVATVAGLRGYVGVDLVLGDAADGSQDWVIEINPRLTTSYIGLRMLAKGSLAEAMLRACQGEAVPCLQWLEAQAHFDAEGDVTVLSTEY